MNCRQTKLNAYELKKLVWNTHVNYSLIASKYISEMARQTRKFLQSMRQKLKTAKPLEKLRQTETQASNPLAPFSLIRTNCTDRKPSSDANRRPDNQIIFIFLRN